MPAMTLRHYFLCLFARCSRYFAFWRADPLPCAPVIYCFFDGDDKADAVALQTLVPLVALLLLDAFKTALHDSKAKGSTAC